MRKTFRVTTAKYFFLLIIPFSILFTLALALNKPVLAGTCSGITFNVAPSNPAPNSAVTVNMSRSGATVVAETGKKSDLN